MKNTFFYFLRIFCSFIPSIFYKFEKGGFLIIHYLELQDSHSPGGMMGTENRLADLCAAAELMQYREQVLDEQKVMCLVTIRILRFLEPCCSNTASWSQSCCSWATSPVPVLRTYPTRPSTTYKYRIRTGSGRHRWRCSLRQRFDPTISSWLKWCAINVWT